MGILYTSGLFTVKGAKEGVIGRPFYKICGGRGPPEWAPFAENGSVHSWVECLWLDILLDHGPTCLDLAPAERLM